MKLSKNQIADIAYAFAQRARLTQPIQGLGMCGSLTGKRVVISTDGGRMRIRSNKKGKHTKKGCRRYRTDWREPKRLAIYVVDEEGKIDRSFTPVLDGSRKGAGCRVRFDRAISVTTRHRRGHQRAVHRGRSQVDLETRWSHGQTPAF